jgi:uridine kinase
MIHRKPVIIGIAGGSGAGKTTIAQAISQGLFDTLDKPNVLTICQDSYYHDRKHLSPADRCEINYDHPDAVDTELLVKHLRLLTSGFSAEIPHYDLCSHMRLKDCTAVRPADVIIVEGLFVLVDSILRELLDIKVFIEVDDDIRFIRRLVRDVSKRGRTIESVIKQYLEMVKPMHLQFIATSSCYADMIIPGIDGNDAAIDLLIRKIHTALM